MLVKTFAMIAAINDDKSDNYLVVGLFHMWEFQRGYGTGLLGHQHVCINTILVFLAVFVRIPDNVTWCAIILSPGSA